jgi:hypothetical protein
MRWRAGDLAIMQLCVCSTPAGHLLGMSGAAVGLEVDAMIQYGVLLGSVASGALVRDVCEGAGATCTARQRHMWCTSR